MAALTIPSLIVKNQEKETVVQLKKVYNTLSNAYLLAQNEYGDPQSWTSENDVLKNSKNFMDKIGVNLNVIRRCDGTKGCWAKAYKHMDGTTTGSIDDENSMSKVQMADSSLLAISLTAQNCDSNNGEGNYENDCGWFFVDVNGFKKPNTIGKDVFSFHLSKNGIFPTGGPKDTTTLANHCRTSNNWGCSAWVIQKGNLDYPPNGTGWDN